MALITAYQSDGNGGNKQVQVEELEEMRIQREKRELVEQLANLLQNNEGLKYITDLKAEVATLKTQMTSLEAK